MLQSHETRRATWFLLALAWIADAGVVCLLNLLDKGWAGRTFDELYRSTFGFVSPPLVYSLTDFAVLGLVIFAIGRLRLVDVGWRFAALFRGAIATMLFWTSMQVMMLLCIALNGHTAKWNPAW